VDTHFLFLRSGNRQKKTHANERRPRIAYDFQPSTSKSAQLSLWNRKWFPWMAFAPYGQLTWTLAIVHSRRQVFDKTVNPLTVL
jgi:hypothetical protein